jgi:hypothetical protein
MDVETTHAIRGIRIEFAELGDGLAELRRELVELRGEVAGLRGDVAQLRDDSALNWSRTQLLFEAVREDIKTLGDARARSTPPRKRRR